MKKKILIGLAVFIGIIIFILISGQGPFVDIPDNTELGKEYKKAGEDEIAQATSNLVLSSIKKLYPEGKTVLRDAHPYSHGCLKGSFQVQPGLSKELSQGLFSKPDTWPVWMRFSNGTTKNTPDTTGGIRGIGIKLMGVAGKKIQGDEKLTQDFLLITNPVLPVGDPAEYLDLFQAALAGKPMGYFFDGMPWNWKLTALKIVIDIRKKKIPNMLDIQYWSTVPFKLGNLAVKYSVKPCKKLNLKIPKNPSEHYLRDGMVEFLNEKNACFEFMVQTQKHPQKMPVEDPAIEWDEKLSAFQTVAIINIPRQKFDSPAQNRFCENLTFNPWHSLPEHRPLGGINRVRKIAYDQIASYRLNVNKVIRREPTGLETF